MITPVGVGAYAVGFGLAKEGEGWYLEHSGSNYGFRCNLMAHVTKGYGSVIMTNGSGGDALIYRLLQIIQKEYKWDTVGQPLSRQYGP